MFDPKFQITPRLSKILMAIEASRQAVAALPVSVTLLESLRESARLASTHYSTQIEGNRLTREQVADVLSGAAFPHRERDEAEVRNYMRALDYFDELVARQTTDISENDIRTIHGLVMDGRRKATPYRDGQNVIRNSSNRKIVYMPPEATDVPGMMEDLVAWINLPHDVPIPIVAAITHYQFATIHPYYDGNGRTARLLTSLVLHKSGYGLNGVYSLEEYYARDLQAYYRALTVGESHNYYFGRADSDITNWVEYFCEGMSDAFDAVRLNATRASEKSGADQSALLRELNTRQRQVVGLFKDNRYVKTKDIAELLGVHPRTALTQCRRWAEQGFLVQQGDSNKTRQWELAEKWVGLVISL